MRYINWKLAPPFYAREERGGPFREMETEAGDLREPDLSRYANLFFSLVSLLRSSKLMKLSYCLNENNSSDKNIYTPSGSFSRKKHG